MFVADRQCFVLELGLDPPWIVPNGIEVLVDGLCELFLCIAFVEFGGLDAMLLNFFSLLSDSIDSVVVEEGVQHLGHLIDSLVHYRLCLF